MMFTGKRLKLMIGMLGMGIIMSCMNYSGAFAEDGATVIITGGTGERTADDTVISGNNVIIVAPTSEPAQVVAPTAVPTTVVSGVDNNKTATIDLNGEEVTQDVKVDEDTDADYDVDSAGASDKAKATKKPVVTSKPKPAKVDTKDDIPKTGVVKWEIIFIFAGIVLLGAGTLLSVRYMKKDRY